MKSSNTREQILPLVIEYFGGDMLAAEVWIDKYALKDKFGNIYDQTPRDMHIRLAREFSRIERKHPNPISFETILTLFDKFKYVIPQGSPMVGIGNDNLLTSLSNCFVIDSSEDSYGGILCTDEEQIQIMKRRGGVGHDLSTLRPNGSFANNSLLSGLGGAVLYAQRFSNSTKEVRQGDRRGALMLSMSIEHPDAERFIDSKLESGNITDANISIRITDKFMECVDEGIDFYQKFPIDLKHSELSELNLPYDKLVPYGDGYVKRVNAKRLWNKIIHNAWKSAEPGVLFWDTIVRESPADCYSKFGFKTTSTNPCGEIPLCPYDSCRLMLMNLFSYVVNPFEKDSYFDGDLFETHAMITQKLMDDMIDLEIEKIDAILNKLSQDPEPDNIKSVEINLWKKIRHQTLQGRRTGLGVTGEGDMLAALGLTYGSEQGNRISSKIHKRLAVASYTSSIIMAKERGCFPVYDYKLEENNPFIRRIYSTLPRELQVMCDKYGRRNISNLTIPPAGTTSLLTQTTSGIEPCFNVVYKRRRRTIDKSKASFTDEQGEMFEEYNVFHHKFTQWYDLNWYRTDVKLFDLDFKKPLSDYSNEELEVLISKSPYHKATANDIDWVNKVRLQGAVQTWVDHSISATTNVPKNTPVNTVAEIYMTAFESGCKGMTIYRDGSRSGILINDTVQEDSFEYVDAVKRPKELECDIYHKRALGEDWIILIGKLSGKPYEIFAFQELPNHTFPSKIDKGVITKIKSGVYQLTGTYSGKEYVVKNFIQYLDEGGQVNTRKFSMMLRHHIDPKFIIQDIEEYATITSFDKVIQRVLKNYTTESNIKCKKCGGTFIHDGGCMKCDGCGESHCG